MAHNVIRVTSPLTGRRALFTGTRSSSCRCTWVAVGRRTAISIHTSVRVFARREVPRGAYVHVVNATGGIYVSETSYE